MHTDASVAVTDSGASVAAIDAAVSAAVPDHDGGRVDGEPFRFPSAYERACSGPSGTDALAARHPSRSGSPVAAVAASRRSASRRAADRSHAAHPGHVSLRERLRSDVRAAVERDPATERPLEVLLTSPGLYARWSHRFTHWLWVRGLRLLARFLATLVRLVTGVEIHPGAELGERVVVDHGQGLVIGSTATVGDDVLLYHGVTLGAREERDGKRHPTVGDDVTIGANATVLGDLTVGDGATVGASAVVVDPVAPDDTVVGVPACSVGEGEVGAAEVTADAPAVDSDAPAEDADAAATDPAAAPADDADRTAPDVAGEGTADAAAAETTAEDGDGAGVGSEDDGDAAPPDEPAPGSTREVHWARQDACDERPRERIGGPSRN